MVRFLTSTLHAWRRRGLTVRRLRELDDHLLSDIGIARKQIAAVAALHSQGEDY